MKLIDYKEILCNCDAKLGIKLSGEVSERTAHKFQCPNCNDFLVINSKNKIEYKDINILSPGLEVEKYDLNPQKVYEILVSKGVTSLFHANTVLTSRTYFEEGALLSRQRVTDRGLEQTAQYTDAKDIAFGINDDIFMDVVDIHNRLIAMNDYGPMLFEFPLTLLRDFPFKFVRITKINPSDWNDTDLDEQRYYTSTEELEDGYYYGNFKSMLMFHHIEGELKLAGNLKRFVIDNPKLAWHGESQEIHKSAIAQFKLALAKSGLKNIKCKLRNCPTYCGCHKQYQEMYSPLIEKKFKVRPR